MPTSSSSAAARSTRSRSSRSWRRPSPCAAAAIGDRPLVACCRRASEAPRRRASPRASSRPRWPRAEPRVSEHLARGSPGPPSALAMASASAMTAGCSASRPSGHSAQALMQSARTRSAGWALGARQAQRPVDPVDRVRVAVSHQPVRSRAPRTSRAPLRRRPGRPPTGARRARLSISASSRREVLLAARAPRAPARFRGAGRPRGSSGSGARGRHPRRRRPRTARRRRRGSSRASPAGSGRRALPAAHEQALGDEAVERVEAGAGDRLGRLDRRAAREHREAREARLLVVAEQLVAPVDRRAQRLLAGGRVAGAGAERAERGVQALGDLGGRQQPAAGGGQLDRQRQPVDAPADLRDRGGVAVARAQTRDRALARARRTARRRRRRPTSPGPRALRARAARAAGRG